MTKVISELTAVINKHKLHPIEVSQAGAWLLYQANKVYTDMTLRRELKLVLQEKLNQEEMEEKLVEIIQEANLEDENSEDGKPSSEKS